MTHGHLVSRSVWVRQQADAFDVVIILVAVEILSAVNLVYT